MTDERPRLRKSLATKAIMLASSAGYRVDDEGNLFNPGGAKLSPWKDKRGYYRFSYSSPGDGISGYKVLVHQLAAYQRFGEIVLTEGIEVRHLNADSGDNSKKNIFYGTPTDNELDKPAHVRKRVATTAAAARRKLTNEQATEVRDNHAAGMTYAAIAVKFSIQKSTVHYIIKGKTYKQGSGQLPTIVKTIKS